MEPKLSNEEIFQTVLYAYLIESGYHTTAQVFQSETPVTAPAPDEPPGFLLDFWNIFYEVYNSRARLHMEQTSRQNQVLVQQPSNTSTQGQVLVQQPSNPSTQNQVLVQQPSNTSTQGQVIVQQPSNPSTQSQVLVQQPSNTSTQSQVLVQQPSNPSTQSQVLVQQPLDIGHLMNNATAQRIWDEAPIQHHSTSVMSNLESAANVNVDQCGHSRFPDNQDAVNSVLSKYRDLNLYDIGPVINTTTAQTIWDETPIQYHSGFGSGAELSSCDISSDGNIVASGGRKLGKKPFICYPGTSRSFSTHDSHKKAITEVRFHPDLNLLATASDDQTIKLWDATTPHRVLCYMENDNLKHRGAVKSLDFHPLEVKTICSSDNAAIKVWDFKKSNKPKSFKEGGRVVRFQPVCGSLLAVANGNGITLLDYPNLLVAKRLQGHVKAINSMCWDVTGEMIASVSEDEVRVWSVTEGQCTHRFPSKGRKFQSVIFHPRYHMSLVIGGHQCLLLLNLENMREYTTPRATELSITGLAATNAQAQSQFIVSASDDSVVKIWK